MMIFGAIAGFIATIESGSPWIGFLFSTIGGALLALIFAVVTQILKQIKLPLG